MRKMMAVAALGFAGFLFGGAPSGAHAQIQEVGNAPTVLYAKHGKPKQQAYWAKSHNHADVIVCVTKGDKAEAVYKISRVQKKWPKKGYYWGGLAGKKYDRLCNR
jgi:hypothetical protein